MTAKRTGGAGLAGVVVAIGLCAAVAFGQNAGGGTGANGGGNAGAKAAAKPAVANQPFKLRVFDAATKQPIAGADVKYGGNTLRMTRTTTDAQGAVTCDIPADQRYVSVRIANPGHVPMALQWRPGQEPTQDNYDAYLQTAVPINGRVMDDIGEPVPGATVVFQVQTDRQAEWPHAKPDISYENTKTDENGNWSYDKTPENLAGIQLGVWHGQYVCNDNNEGYFPFSEVAKPDTLRDGSSVLTLKRGVKVSGRVVDSAGKPVARATIGIGRDRVASNVMPPVKVDAEGKFTVAGVAGQPLTLTALAKGLAPDLQTVDVKEEMGELTFTLGPPQTISGRVVDSSGKGIPNVGVAFDGWRGARTISKRVQTDAAGRFNWKEAPADEVLVDVFDSAHADQRKIPMTAGRDNVVTMAAPLRVTGTVIDDETGAPVPAFTYIRGIAFSRDQIHWQRESGRYGDGTGRDGTFVAEFSYPYPGNMIRIEAPGYLPSVSPSWSTSGGEQVYTFRLKRGQDVAAIVSDKDGRPVADCVVALVQAGQPLQISNGRLMPYNRTAPFTKTDAAGKFSLPPQAEAYRVIALSDAGLADVTSEELTAAGKLTLQPWARVEGDVFIGSQPAGGAMVDGHVDTVYEQGWEKKPRVMYGLEAKADDAGHFVFDRVPPMKMSIGRRLQLSNQSYTATANEKVDAKPGETVKVRIGGVGRPVVGKVELSPELAGQPWGGYFAHMSKDQASAPPPYPDGYAKWSAAEKKKWFDEWRKSPEGLAYFKKAFGGAAGGPTKFYSFAIAADGTFKVDDVEPGTYQLSVQLQKPSREEGGMGQILANGRATITVPKVDGGQSDEPLTVPTIIAAPMGQRVANRVATPATKPATQP